MVILCKAAVVSLQACAGAWRRFRRRVDGVLDARPWSSLSGGVATVHPPRRRRSDAVAASGRIFWSFTASLRGYSSSLSQAKMRRPRQLSKRAGVVMRTSAIRRSKTL